MSGPSDEGLKTGTTIQIISNQQMIPRSQNYKKVTAKFKMAV